jgi:hypothetical protein
MTDMTKEIEDQVVSAGLKFLKSINLNGDDNSTNSIILRAAAKGVIEAIISLDDKKLYVLRLEQNQIGQQTVLESDAVFRGRIYKRIKSMNDLDRYALALVTGAALDEVGSHVGMTRWKFPPKNETMWPEGWGEATS